MKSYMSKSSTTSWKDCSVFLGLIWAQIYMYIHMRTNECIVYGPCTSWCVLYTWRGGPSQGMLKIISNMGTMGNLWIHQLYIFKHHFFFVSGISIVVFITVATCSCSRKYKNIWYVRSVFWYVPVCPDVWKTACWSRSFCFGRPWMEGNSWISSAELLLSPFLR